MPQSHELLDLLAQFDGCLTIGGCRFVALGGGQFRLRGLDRILDTRQLIEVRRGLGIELVEASAGLSVAVGVSVIGDDPAFLLTSHLRLSEPLALGFQIADDFFGLFNIHVSHHSYRSPVLTRHARPGGDLAARGDG